VVLDDKGRELAAVTHRESLVGDEATAEEMGVSKESTPALLATALGCPLATLRAKLTSRTMRAGAGE
jgi:hypothetical protein